MKTWKKIISIVALVAIVGLLGFTVISGWGKYHKGSARNINQGLDLYGGVSVTYEADGDITSQELSDVVYKMQQRIQGFDGAQAYSEGNNRVTIEIPGADDATTILEELGKPGSIYFIIEKSGEKDTANFGYYQEIGGFALSRTLDEIEKDGGIILTGSDVKDCVGRYEDEQNSKSPVVAFELTDDASKRFADATEKCANNSWRLGVYYDDHFISVPTCNSKITGGRGVIEGMDSLEEAKNLASYIRIGALPVELNEITSKVVGATLGKDAISTSLYAGAIGFALLFIFMLAFYRIPGLAANIALAVYAGGMLLILNVFNLTLTLPGIAGIVLSIGMAVDANVIIFARIREELATGISLDSAIKIGFKKALSAIVDGNVTTLIAALVLGIIGTGPVRGFAITLGIGIVLSMITSLLVTRFILMLFYHCGCKKVGMYGVTKERPAMNFVAKRKLFFSISGLVIATGVAFLVVHAVKDNSAFNLDLEFSGGTATSVKFDREYTTEEIENDIIPVIKEATGSKTVQQQKVKNSNTIVFKTQMLENETREKLNKALADKFGIDVADSDVVSSENISATMSSEMRRDAIIAVVVATLCMLLYIWIRFRDVKFATSAIMALIHDVLVVIGFYAISRTNVGTTFIACMLTIVGYSINATIVIFDRIRENMKVMKKESLANVVNKSITSTLSRSINTSLTTFVMVFVLYIMGVSSIKEFAAPIMVGIVCGAYSSTCVAGVLWFVMKKASYKRAIRKEK